MHSFRRIKKSLVLVPLLGGLLATPLALAAPAETAAGPHAAGAAPGPAVVGKTISSQRQAAVKDYWTKERMASAKPVKMTAVKTDATSGLAARSDRGTPVTVAPAGAGGKALAPTTEQTAAVEPMIYGRAYSYPAPFTRFETFPAGSYNAYPNRTVGKLFFSNSSGGNFVCSASIVNSENKDIVWTAGHCVSNGAGTFYQNWQFVPARRLGANPFGVWTPREVWALTEWHVAGNFRQDLAALIMNNDSSGNSIANRLGSLGIQFNANRIRSWNAMGYPAASPFSGERQYQNIASYAASDTPTSRPGPDTIGMGNDLTGGSSGGPWIAAYSAGGGYVNGVNSYKYTTPSMPLEMYSPYFGNEAFDLYNTVRAR